MDLTHTLFEISTEDEKIITSHYGKTKEEIEDLLEEIIQWKNDQPHLPEDTELGHIYIMLHLNKFNIAKTKWKLDNYYAYKNFAPEFYEDREITNPRIRNVLDNVMLCPLPKLYKNRYRVSVGKLINHDPKIFDMEALFRLVFAVADLRIHLDRCISDIYILDGSGLQWRHILKIKPMLIKKGFDVIRNVFSDSITGIHLINIPYFAIAAFKVTSTFLPTKIAKRFYIHETEETLKEHIDTKILPEDYGGKETSMEEIYENFKLFLESNSEWLNEEIKKKTNENLRPKDYKPYSKNN